MHTNFKKGFCIGCLALSSLFLSIIDTRQDNLSTDKNNTIFQTYQTAPDTSTIIQKTNVASGSATTSTPTISSSAMASISPSATQTTPTSSTISPSMTPGNATNNSPSPTASAYTTASATPTTTATILPITNSALSVSELYIQYQGKEIASPVVLTKNDFLVTAIMEDGSYCYVTDYSFTSKTIVSLSLRFPETNIFPL